MALIDFLFTEDTALALLNRNNGMMNCKNLLTGIKEV